MKRFTLGIAFDTEENIVLIKKTKPEWQAGKFNFVGGKIEKGEKPIDCINREFREETSVDIPPEKWRYVGKMYREKDFIVYIYLTYDKEVANVTTTTEEEIYKVSIDKFEIDSNFQKLLMPNLKVIYEFVKSDDYLNTNAELIIKFPKHE